MSEKPHLVAVSPVRSSGHFFYQCSRCGQPFILPEDRNPKDGAAELLAAFREHVGEQHPEEVEG
jgi:hypothetical protein